MLATKGSEFSRRCPGNRDHYFHPGKLHADKAYAVPDLRRRLRRTRITPRIARRGTESKECLGRHRRVIEGTISWLTG